MLLLILAILLLYVLSEKEPVNIDEYINQVAKENGIDPDLVRAIIQVESSWNPDAARVEPNGYKSIGLMQVTIQAARDVGYRGSEEGLFNPMTNIKYGVKYLRRMLNMFNGNIYKAIAAYNAGPGNVRRGRFSFAYVYKVMREYNRLKQYA